MKQPTTLFSLILAACLLCSCQPNPSVGIAQPPAPQTLIVFAAASLTNIFQETGAAFSAQHPGAQVVFNFAGSQQLAQQIVQGAEADIFASADMAQMQVIIDSGQVDPAQSKLFAHNRLVIIYPPDNSASLHTLPDLARPGIKLVLAASAVPAGRYALTFLDQAAQDAALGPVFRQGVLDNVVSYEENVRAVLSKVILGEADAGIVYSSDVDDNKVGTLEIPDNLNVLASYYIAPLKDSSQSNLAQAFIEFLLSPAGAHILDSYGLIPITP